MIESLTVLTSNSDTADRSVPVRNALEENMNGDEPHMLVLDATLMFAVPKLTADAQHRDTAQTRCEYLENVLDQLVGGFTRLDANGVWRRTAEAVYLYIVAVPKAYVNAVFRVLIDICQGEEAIFVTVNGIATLLFPSRSDEVQHAA